MVTESKTCTVRAHVFISGQVQGMDFRWYTKNKAQALGLTGWVRDLLDGRVEAIFEGEERAVQQAVNWCRLDAPSAWWIDHVEVSFEQPTDDFDSFHITW